MTPSRRIGKNIVILEDNAERQAEMKRCLDDSFHKYGHIFFETARKMVGHLESDLSNAIIISLDHDLEFKPVGKGNGADPDTGRESR